MGLTSNSSLNGHKIIFCEASYSERELTVLQMKISVVAMNYKNKYLVEWIVSSFVDFPNISSFIYTELNDLRDNLTYKMYKSILCSQLPNASFKRRLRLYFIFMNFIFVDISALSTYKLRRITHKLCKAKMALC